MNRSFFSAATASGILLSLCFAIAGSNNVAANDAEPVPGDSPEAAAGWHAGIAKVDITPQEPVRMAGYGNRDSPSQGVDSPLSVRCLTLLPDGAASAEDAGREAYFLISIDTIGLPGSLTRQIASRLEVDLGVRRERLVIASTHTHCAPDLVSELSNIFTTPLSDAERAAGLRYRARLVEAVIEAATTAVEDLQPGTLHHGSGAAKFAANRRVLEQGRWAGFGVQPDGPVDHTADVLRVTTPAGELRAVVFNYACHGTTLGGDHYRINGDWSGFASEMLESRHPGIVALSTIGCGADANPEPRGSLEAAVRHGGELADEVDRVIAAAMRPLGDSITANFDHAALSFELPTIEEVLELRQSGTPQAKRHAAELEQTYREAGRLPATYPVPIQSWQFGDRLTMIFLGGEVVVDYALRLKREFADQPLWVTAYANDVLGYIASERMRREGGYEYDRSAIYYGLPGPWAAGTEDEFIAQIRDLVESDRPRSPVAASDALSTMRLSSDQYRIELVAAEPLLADPINLAFGHDGKLWVVEMGDYPTGDRGGRVKFLEDTTGDGEFDRSTLFLEGLSFPTAVHPWRDGVVITAAPDILFARDRNGDGRADQVEPLFSGFRLANPQHRVSGFSYGLDHSLHCASGDNLGAITSVRTGEVVDASGHDVQIWPDDGRIATTTGRTQFVRSRDDWGQWFGNDNSRPMFHYPIESALLKRNPAVTFTSGAQQLFDPPVAPPVFPVTSSAVRFNDLYAANRFTSACSAIVSRSPHFNVGDGLDTDDNPAAFVCEPVHNLVHRAVLIRQGASYRATRHATETAAEFLASTDPWFRPVRCEIGPDGALWVVDMYRQTIEHPEWIPAAWQAQLDLTAGNDRGRIYRVLPRSATVAPNRPISDLSLSESVALLHSPIGPLRDTAQRLIIERVTAAETDGASAVAGCVEELRDLAKGPAPATARVHALSILDVLDRLDESLIDSALTASEPGLLLVAVRLAASRVAAADRASRLVDRLASLATHDDLRVVTATALALGQTDRSVAGQALATIAGRPDIDDWVTSAVLSSAKPHAGKLLGPLLIDLIERRDQAEPTFTPATLRLLSGLLDTAIAGGGDVSEPLRAAFAATADDAAIDTRLSLAVCTAQSFTRAGVDPAEAMSLVEPIYLEAVEIAADPSRPENVRRQALELFGRGIGDAETERQLLSGLLSPTVPASVQRRAVAALAAIDREHFVDFVIEQWPQLTSSLRDVCVHQMLTRQVWLSQLLTALESGQIGINELSASSRQQLLHSGSRSMMVRAQRLIDRSGATSTKGELVDSYLAGFKSAPNTPDSAGIGEALFGKHCGNCHIADQRGQTIGPSLANLSDRRDRSLVEAILDPNAAVEPRFQSYLIRTDSDELIAGAIDSEVGDTITLAKADGSRVSINRGRIAEMKNSGISLMPDGFESLLTPTELEAIVRHIQRATSDRD